MTPRKHDRPPTGINIGARLQAEMQRRVRELEARCPQAMTQHDRRELVALHELLKLKTKE